MTAALSKPTPETRAIPVPLADLQAQRSRLEGRVEAAVARVLEHGRFILGPEVKSFESELARFTGAKHVVSCASGTDALALIGMAEDIGPGDVVFVPAFTFVATAGAMAKLGATPCFVDVEAGSFNMDPESLAAAIAACREQGWGQPRMIVAVDLFGLPADYSRIGAIAEEEDIVLVADAAQSIGASSGSGKVGSIASYTAASFFPSKPLGCYGDGGAVLTSDDERAEKLRSIRMHGKGASKYEPVRVGLNSRLDTIQAAILLEKLGIFADELAARRGIARRYEDHLKGVCETPMEPVGVNSAWALYTIRTARREQVAAACAREKIATGVYYPLPLNRMPPYRECPVTPGGVPVAEQLCRQVISLPMHPYLDEAVQDRVAATILGALQ